MVNCKNKGRILGTICQSMSFKVYWSIILTGYQGFDVRRIYPLDKNHPLDKSNTIYTSYPGDNLSNG